jgi:hypothetical protein
MWEPRLLTTLWAFTACYKDSFTLPFLTLKWNESFGTLGGTPLRTIELRRSDGAERDTVLIMRPKSVCLSEETSSPEVVNREKVASSFLRTEFLPDFLQCL